VLLLFASTALAQTTTTTTVPLNCVVAPASDLKAAAASDPEFAPVMGWAALHRLDTVNIPPLSKCTDSTGVLWVGRLNSLVPNRPQATFSYSTTQPYLQHTTIYYHKNRRMLLVVTDIITNRITYAADGVTVKRAVYLNLAGHRIHFPASATTTTLGAAVRGFL